MVCEQVAFIFKESFKFASILEQTVVLIATVVAVAQFRAQSSTPRWQARITRTWVAGRPRSRWSLKPIPCTETCLFVAENLSGQHCAARSLGGGGAELKLSLDHLADAIVHVLDEVLLGAAETTTVGDVEDAIAGVGVLSVAAADLHVVVVGDLLEAIPVLHQVGQVDMHGGAHGSAEVGRARRDVAEVVVVGELGDGLNVLGGAAQALEDGADVSTLLHGDDTELILLVDPDQESLVSVVEDTTALGPVTLHTGYLQVGVTRHEEEMVIDELLADLLIHTGQGVVGTGQVTFHFGECVLHQSLNIDTLLLGDTGGKTESLDAAANTDPGIMFKSCNQAQ